MIWSEHVAKICADSCEQAVRKNISKRKIVFTFCFSQTFIYLFILCRVDSSIDLSHSLE